VLSLLLSLSRARGQQQQQWLADVRYSAGNSGWQALANWDSVCAAADFYGKWYCTMNSGRDDVSSAVGLRLSLGLSKAFPWPWKGLHESLVIRWSECNGEEQRHGLIWRGPWACTPVWSLEAPSNKNFGFVGAYFAASPKNSYKCQIVNRDRQTLPLHARPWAPSSLNTNGSWLPLCDCDYKIYCHTGL
jgi:hypothetical protein